MSLNPRFTSWTGKRVWIIGGSTGIGRATAILLHTCGAVVAVSARKLDVLNALAGEHQGMLALPLDLNDMEAVRRAQTTLVEQWGGIDLVVCAAGAYTATRAWELTPERVDEMMGVNLISTMKATAILIPQLLKQGSGTVAFISSVAGYRGLPKALVYGPSKAALTNFAETLYLDLHTKNIGVVIINPGFVRTPMTSQNDFNMPALIEPEEAAREIKDGLEAGIFEIHFPKRFTRVLKFLRWWPDTLYFKFIKRIV
jgi:NAD(P)-dependent dehydrogenase (short-subunit alcohol dehydrogenase family)